jgi:predicted phage terminase large subunit-like protein
MQAQNVGTLSEFIRDGWHVLEPTTPCEWNWHIDAVSLHLTAAIDDWIAIQKWRAAQQSAVVTRLVGGAQVREELAELEEAESEDADRGPIQRIQNLLINIPPGTAKSRIVSVFFPAYVWLKWPSFRFIYLSANPRVAERDSVYCRDLVESKWYRETFEVAWRLRPDQNGKRSFWNTAGGSRSAFGFFSRITGDRGDAIVWDDPHDADEIHSETLRQGVLDRWDNAIGNRVNDGRCSLRIGVMQRLHEEDLSGHVLAGGNWEHLCLPMEWESVSACQCRSCSRGETAIGWRDPRSLPDAKTHLLFSRRFTIALLASEKIRLGSAGYAGQMQQRPAPAGGEILKTHWWRFWVPKGMLEHFPPYKVRMADGTYAVAKVEERPDDDEFDEMLQSWDMAFKETKDSDFVVGGVWARLGSRKYLIDQVRDRMSFTRTVNAVVKLSEAWPKARRKLIEDKANGPAVISALEGKVAGMLAVEPEGGKTARAHAVTPDIEAGDVYLPHPLLYTLSEYKDYTWIEAFIAECTAFPRGAKDDQVDQMTQALKRWIAGKKKKTPPEPQVF